MTVASVFLLSLDSKLQLCIQHFKQIQTVKTYAPTAGLLIYYAGARGCVTRVLIGFQVVCAGEWFFLLSALGSSTFTTAGRGWGSFVGSVDGRWVQVVF